MTLKLVPIRAGVDFEGYGNWQLGFRVADIAAVIESAKTLGGRQEGELLLEDDRLHASVRDPDGNTIELYQNR